MQKVVLFVLTRRLRKFILGPTRKCIRRCLVEARCSARTRFLWAVTSHAVKGEIRGVDLPLEFGRPPTLRKSITKVYALRSVLGDEFYDG